MNKTVNGAQCTVGWHVDDNKIAHVDTRVVTDVIKMIEKDFGKMVVTRGKQHMFLCMDIEFCDDGCLEIFMKSYLEEAINEFGDDVPCLATLAAKKDLFEVDVKSPALPAKKQDVFHSVVAKLLYVSQQGRPDIQPTIAFLCTRVSCSTEQDWAKLQQLLQFIKGTIDDKHRLGADDMGKLMTWVDAAYGVHHDMKSHTGGMMSLGTGTSMCKSTKQKLNTKSSTEAELVGATDYLPNTIWAKMFLEGQGYEVTENNFVQDNQSAIKLEMNDRASSGQKTRHIAIRFFFMEDQVKAERINIFHCPTDLMLADFNTKPLQGALFHKFRRVIMGYNHINILRRPATDSIKERVGNQDVSFVNMIEPDTRPTETYLSVAKHAVTWAADAANQPNARMYGAKERAQDREANRRKIYGKLKANKRGSVFLN